MKRSTLSKLRTSVSGLALAVGYCLAAPLAHALPTHNAAVVAPDAKDMGAADPRAEMKLTVMLKLHNEAKLDAVMDQLYDRSSALYRKWLTPSDLAAYAPTSAELNAVKAELISHGYAVMSVDPQNFSIRVRGTVAITEQAFQTTLHSYTRNNKSFIAHTSDAQLTGAAGALVASVAGLDQHAVRTMRAQAKDLRTGLPPAPQTVTAATASSIGSMFSNVTLGPVATHTVTDPQGLTGTFTGATYAPQGLPIGNTPQQLQAYYGMQPFYKLGYRGNGQSIALLEAYGYDAAKTDGNAFSTIFNLPALNARNFKVLYPEGKPADPNAGYLEGWAGEIALDIEAAHSLAPAAEIDVVASNGQDSEDMIASMQYIINKNIAHVISGSFEEEIDEIASPVDIEAYNTVLKLGAAQGYAFQFATGDAGDNGVGAPIGASAYPSESPYATAVGGTSLVNDPNHAKQFYPTGWGTVGQYLYDENISVGGFSEFVGGSGGGQSIMVPKPKWQSALPGTGRLVPDVAALANPYTGFIYVLTSQAGVQQISIVGGTSLASPLFSAIWVIADQYAGHPLGQAAPAISRLTSAHITDVQPLGLFSTSNVTATVTDASGNTTTYSAAQLFASYDENQAGLTSAFHVASNGAWVAIAFDLDSSLRCVPGWDDSTGYGEPNGIPFITGVVK